jgi:hypothetical protein
VPKPQPGQGDTVQTPVGQLFAGVSIAATLTGTVTTASPAAPLITLDDGSTATLPGSLVVTVRSEPIPTTQGSAILASVNGAPNETLVLLPNGTAGLAWRAADGFHPASDLSRVQVIYLAPPVPIHGSPS